MEFLFDELHLDFLYVLLLLFFHALADFLFQPLFHSLAGQHFCQHILQFVQDIDDFFIGRHLIIRRIFIDQPLQADDTAPGVFGVHVRKGRIFAGPEDHLFRADQTGKCTIQDIYLTAQFFLCRRFQILMTLQQLIQ